MSEIVVTDDKNGDRVALRVDDALTIRLQESPTTGYRWTLTTEETGPLELAADTFSPGSGTGVGGGGVRSFRFLARRPGTRRLQLALSREWEAAKAKKVFALSVTVS